MPPNTSPQASGSVIAQLATAIVSKLNSKNVLALSAGGIVCFTIYQVILAILKERKIKSLGARAPMLWKSPIGGIPYVVNIAKAAAGNNLKAFYAELFGEHTVLEGQMTTSLRCVMTREPEHVKAMLATDFASFGKGEIFHRLTEPFLGNGIFSTDGKLWQDSRNLIRPFFVNERVRDLDIFERSIQKLISKLPPRGQTVEIMELINRMTFDATMDFLLGVSTNSLDSTEDTFMDAFDTVQREQMFLLMVSSPWDAFVSRKKYYKSIKAVDNFMIPYIHKTLALPLEELEKLSKSDRDYTFLHGLARFTRDPKVIRDQLIAILLAGRDTTAATLSWALYELSAYPEKYQRLRQEVLDVVGRHEAPTYKTLKEMKYLRFTIQETLRLYPAVPINVKMALRDTTLPVTANSPAIGICKGDQVAWGPLTIQLRKDLYPPTSNEFADPEVFSPERWYVWQPRPWEYVPFNGGPRVCIGQNFANTELAYCLVRILQKYKTIEYRGDWDAQLRTADMVARPSAGVPLAMFEAADDE